LYRVGGPHGPLATTHRRGPRAGNSAHRRGYFRLPGGALWGYVNARWPGYPSWIILTRWRAADRGLRTSIPSPPSGALFGSPDPASDVESAAEWARSWTRHPRPPGSAERHRLMSGPCNQFVLRNHLPDYTTGSLKPIAAVRTNLSIHASVQTQNTVGGSNTSAGLVDLGSGAGPTNGALVTQIVDNLYKIYGSHLRASRSTMPRRSSPKAAFSPRRKRRNEPGVLFDGQAKFPYRAIFQRRRHSTRPGRRWALQPQEGMAHTSPQPAGRGGGGHCVRLA